MEEFILSQSHYSVPFRNQFTERLTSLWSGVPIARNREKHLDSPDENHRSFGDDEQ